MSNYYVRTDTGSDTTGSGSQAAPWKTIGKAVTTISPSGSGDVVYVGSGTYAEQVTPSVAATSASPLSVVADVDGSQTGAAPGEVILTSYVSGNGTVPPNANHTITSSTVSYYTWTGLTIVAGKGRCVSLSGSGCLNWTFNDCTFLGGGGADHVVQVTASGVATGHAFNRCRAVAFLSTATIAAFSLVGATVAGADYSTGFALNHCTAINNTGPAVFFNSTGAGAGHAGGVTVSGCTLFGTYGFRVNSTFISTTVPSVLDHNMIFGVNGITVATSGQATDGGYNEIYANTPLTNVTAATGTVTDYRNAPMVSVGQEFAVGRATRPFLAPTADGTVVGRATTFGTVDSLNRTRSQTVGTPGAYEMHDSYARSSNTLRVTRPIDVEFRVPVSASATTISVQVQWDSSYGAGTLPQLILVANGEIGVAAQAVTATGSAAAWNTITLASFTPTAAGEVRVRLSGVNMAAAGVLLWGSPSVSPPSATTGLDHAYRGEFVPYLVPPAPAAVIVPGPVFNRYYVHEGDY